MELPCWHDAIRARNIAALPDSLRSTLPYDRVSGDRALAIWSDLEQLAPGRRLTIVDLGCNIGMIGQSLASVGHHVLGIDNDVAGMVQSYYPADNETVSRHVAQRNGIGNFSFSRQSIEHFARGNERFDVGLLLSVAHQWWAGYAGTSTGKKSLEDIYALASGLIQRFQLALYLEHPITLDGMQPGIDAASFLSFPQWFVSTGHAKSVTELALSPDAHGALRMIYRVIPAHG